MGDEIWLAFATIYSTNRMQNLNQDKPYCTHFPCASWTLVALIRVLIGSLGCVVLVGSRTCFTAFSLECNLYDKKKERNKTKHKKNQTNKQRKRNWELSYFQLQFSTSQPPPYPRRETGKVVALPSLAPLLANKW